MCVLYILCPPSFIPAAALTGRSGLSCTGCRSGSGRSAASGRERCRTAFSSTRMSHLVSAVEEGRVRGKGNDGVGAIQVDQSGASVWWSGGSERAGAMVLRPGSVSGQPGRKLAAAGGRRDAGLEVLEGVE